MYFCQVPYMFAYYPVQQYPEMNFYNPIPVFYDSQQNYESSHPEQKQQKTNAPVAQNVRQSTHLKSKRRIIRKLTPKVQKKLGNQPFHQNDLQFRQREQTANRNLNSNTLKVYFKQLRDQKTETSMNISRIIETNKINMTPSKFMRKLNSMFPPHATYISFDQFKKKLIGNYIQQEEINFIKILRTSIRRFYSYQLFAVNIKSARTTRKIRNQQIRQGKLLLRQLSL